MTKLNLLKSCNRRPALCSIFLIVSLLISQFSFAQKTKIYTDRESDYKKGVELFEQKKFGAAGKKFERIIEMYESNTDHRDNTLLNALYYRAVCADETSHPSAEKYFTDLIDEYGENPTTRLAYYHLGNIYFNNKKFSQALTQYKKVDIYDLNIQQTSEFKFQIGYCYFYKQKFAEAKTYFEAVKSIKNKYYYPANYYYGYLSYLDKNYSEALAGFKLIQESQLYAPIVPYYITQIYFMNGQYDDVLMYAVPLLQRNDLKYTNEMRQLIGKSYFNTGDYATSLPFLQEFYDKSQQSSKTDIYQIAFCEYKLKMYPQAITHFLQLSLLSDSVGQNVQYLLGDCYLKTNDKQSARRAFQNAAKYDFDMKAKESSMYNYAKLSYELGYQDVAIKSFNDFVTAFPKSSNAAEAREYLVQLFLNTNNYRDALSIIKTIENKNPQLKEAYQKVAFNRAMQVYADNDYNTAGNLMDESLHNPIDRSLEADAYYWKGEIAFDQKNYKNAIINFIKYINLSKASGASKSGASVLQANYGIGYAYLKQANYTQAIAYFDNAKSLLSNSTLSKNSVSKLGNDIFLRSGDCHFILKNYNGALSDYQQVIANKGTGVDYALFQKGMILGLQGKNEEKVKTLQRINNEFPFSIYLDDALFETGSTYLVMGENDKGMLIFNRMITDFPNSNYVKRAHLKLGLIYFNESKYENALDEYKTVASTYPNSPEAKDAVNSIKQVFITKGDAKGFTDFVKQIPNVSIGATAQDSLIYLAAEQNFSDENFDKALDGFTDYLNTFPNGAFALQAHYYRAECLSRNKDYAHALEDYQWVAGKSSSAFSEKAMLQSARINYTIIKDYPSAYKYYKQLSEVTNVKSNLLEAWQGTMFTAYRLNKNEEVKMAAEKILSSDIAKNESIADAHYYLAKTAMDRSDFATAATEFKKVSQLLQSEKSAEALYFIAFISFKQNDLKLAEEQAFKVINQKPQYNYWIGKSYILLSDIYAAEDDWFNAKAALQGIIDNYKGNDDIVPTAQEKMKVLTEKENAGSKLMQDSIQHQFQMDTLEEFFTPVDTLKKK